MLLRVPVFGFKLFYSNPKGNVNTRCFNSLQNTAGNLCLLQKRVTLNCTIIIRVTNTLSMPVACLPHAKHLVTNCLVIKDQSLLTAFAFLTGKEFDCTRTCVNGINTNNFLLRVIPTRYIIQLCIQLELYATKY